MERTSRFCTNCGSELDTGANFCGQCGTPTRRTEAPEPPDKAVSQPPQEDAPMPAAAAVEQPPQEKSPSSTAEDPEQPSWEEAPVKASAATGQPRKSDPRAGMDKDSHQPRAANAPVAPSTTSAEPREDDTPVAPDKDWSKFSRFLKIDPSGGFLAIVTPLFVWTVAAGTLTWAVLGLISLRFDLSILNLEDLFFTMLLVIGIMVSVVANAYLAISYRERAGALAQSLSFLPMLWAAFLCVGLTVMIWQVWTDFAGGPNELRRAMFSLIGVGVCGVYGGYLSLVGIGASRIFQAVRRVVYVLIAIVAVEILDALWLGSRDVTGIEMWEHFLRAGLTAVTCAIVYAIIAFFIAQARTRKSQASMLVTYLVLGVFGFTIAVGALWDTFPPGAIRFVHGAIVIVTIASIGLLVVQHYLKKQESGNSPPDFARPASRTGQGTTA